MKTTPAPVMPEKWWVGKKSHCGHCFLNIEFEESDSPKITSYGYGRWVAEFKCPKCGKTGHNFSDI